MKSKADRHAWLLNRIKEQGEVDILNQKFVDDYIAFSEAPAKLMMFGAAKCPTLGRDLAVLYDENKLTRWACGLPGAESGFPKWVYCYDLPKAKE